MLGLLEGADVGVGEGRGVLVGGGVGEGPVAVGGAVVAMPVSCVGNVGVSRGASGAHPPASVNIATSTSEPSKRAVEVLVVTITYSPCSLCSVSNIMNQD